METLEGRGAVGRYGVVCDARTIEELDATRVLLRERGTSPID